MRQLIRVLLLQTWGLLPLEVIGRVHQLASELAAQATLDAERFSLITASWPTIVCLIGCKETILLLISSQSILDVIGLP